MNRMHFCCQSVAGGWQTGVWFTAGISFADHPEPTYPIGPVFNKTTDLWDWQRANLPTTHSLTKDTP
jgi:hypothetical protein